MPTLEEAIAEAKAKYNQKDAEKKRRRKGTQISQASEEINRQIGSTPVEPPETRRVGPVPNTSIPNRRAE